MIGLNTAATLWASAAVGALAGAWMWREAIAGAVIIIAANALLFPLANRMDRAHSRFGRAIPPADYLVEVVVRRTPRPAYADRSSRRSAAAGCCSGR